MAGYNRVILMGNLTRDPQLRYLPSNMAVCDFGIAVSRRFRDREGNQRDEVCFVDVSAWGKQGETINQYMSKGKPILIEGRLKLDQWTAQDGSKRSKLSVVVDNFQFVGSRDGGGSGGRDGGDEGGGRRGPSGPSHTDGPVDDYVDQPPSGDDIPF